MAKCLTNDQCDALEVFLREMSSTYVPRDCSPDENYCEGCGAYSTHHNDIEHADDCIVMEILSLLE